MNTLIEQLLESWTIHARINLFMLDAVPSDTLDAVSASGGRTVGEQFAHIHNVRLMWLKAASPELLEGLAKIEKGDAGSPDSLRTGLVASADAIASLLRSALESGGRVKGFKPHAPAFHAYLVSHESHHRGQIALTLKQAGRPLDRKLLYGMWEWGSR